MIVSIIVAMDHNQVIGVNGQIPWRIPEDLTWFKNITNTGVLVMGRKTWDSLPNKPLPNRTHIVLTSDPDWKQAGAVRASSWEGALSLCRALDARMVFAIGGREIYRRALEVADKAYVTRVNVPAIYNDDDEVTRFPECDILSWDVVYQRKTETCEFIALEKIL